MWENTLHIDLAWVVRGQTKACLPRGIEVTTLDLDGVRRIHLFHQRSEKFARLNNS